jgi:2-dehydropantoate 2-reductase
MTHCRKRPRASAAGHRRGIMRICVVGAGSIGGHLATLFATVGHDVTVVARGAHLEAIRKNGLRLILDDGSEHLVRHMPATDDIRAVGPMDLVILAVKANQVEPVVDDLLTLFHDRTVLIPMQNGIPWWYFQRHGGPHEGHCVRTVDPNARIMTAIDPARIIGCVVYPAAGIEAPGIVRHIEGNRYPLGELDGSTTERITRIAELFTAAGLKSPILDNIRAEIWLKLWGNLSFNPISALTHSTLVDLCQFPLTRELARSMMEEAQAIANALGIQFRVTIDKRIAGAEKVGKHKTSMLQDIEAGRQPEIDALVGSVIELGRLTGIATPHLDSVHALVKLLAHTMAADRSCVRAVSTVARERAAPTLSATGGIAMPA